MQELSSHKFTIPTILIVFGITGDLVRKKILKSLYHLYLKNLISKKFKIYGFSRRDLNDVTLRAYLKEIMMENSFPYEEKYNGFLNSFFYIKGDFTQKEAYKSLSDELGMIDSTWNVCANKLFYLAVPPQDYEDIITNLHTSSLTLPCSKEEGWTRVILEKPFGTNLKTAKKLDNLLGNTFKEEQIYRVDHYLAKETVRNILSFRFSNIFFTPLWDKKYIEKIEVKLLQKDGVYGRADFYDNIGALTDVGQNHLLQLLALFIMREPREFAPNEIKEERAKAIASLKKLNIKDIYKNTKRGQFYSYKNIEGVKKNSETETYFKIKAFSNDKKFQGVPFELEAGKWMKETVVEVAVTFKPQKNTLNFKKNFKNKLIYQLLPQEKISICFLSKTPGFEYNLKEHELGFNYRQAYEKELFVDDYEALLYDILRGDQTLFVSTKEIFSQWAFIEPILRSWKVLNKPKLEIYK